MHVVKHSHTNVETTSSGVCSDLESRTGNMINFSLRSDAELRRVPPFQTPRTQIYLRFIKYEKIYGRRGFRPCPPAVRLPPLMSAGS